MRASDLDLRELLDFDPKGGIIRFAGDRALLFNTVALGLLRRTDAAEAAVAVNYPHRPYLLEGVDRKQRFDRRFADNCAGLTGCCVN